MSQLTNYIEKELSKGYSKDLIKQKLLKAGYKQEVIEDSFHLIEGKKDFIVRKKHHFYDSIHLDPHVLRSKWLFPVIGIVCLIVLVVLLLSNIDFSEIDKGEDLLETTVSISDCKKLSGDGKDICILELAKQTDDIEYCDELFNEGLKSFCVNKGWEQNTCSYESLIGEREDCLKTKAIENSDDNYCYISEDVNTCLVEMSVSLNDVKYCDEVPECVGGVAAETNNIGLCDEIESKAQCYREYSFLTDTNVCSDNDIECELYFAETDDEKREVIGEYVEYLINYDEEFDLDEFLITLKDKYSENIFCEYVAEEIQAKC